MVKHTETIRQQQPTNCLNVFGHFVGWRFKGQKDEQTSLKLGHSWLNMHLMSSTPSICSIKQYYREFGLSSVCNVVQLIHAIFFIHISQEIKQQINYGSQILHLMMRFLKFLKFCSFHVISCQFFFCCCCISLSSAMLMLFFSPDSNYEEKGSSLMGIVTQKLHCEEAGQLWSQQLIFVHGSVKQRPNLEAPVDLWVEIDQNAVSNIGLVKLSP